MLKTNRPFRAASYNIRKCIGLDRQRRPERTLEVIAALDADLVALQEADKRLGKRTATLDRDEIARNTDLEPVEIAINETSLGWHGNAVLMRKGTPIHAAQRLDLPGLEPRGAVLVEFSVAGQPLRAVATHLGLTRQMRRAQLEAIASQVRNREAMPTIILGDFNEWRVDHGLEALEADYDVHAPGRSYHAARPIAALDRIAIDRGLDLVDAGVVETGASRRASDHLPVWADLRNS